MHEAHSIHKARLERSPRLQRIMQVLADGCEHTTWEIQEKARSCAVGTSVSELRAQGFRIICRRLAKKVTWTYRLVEA